MAVILLVVGLGWCWGSLTSVRAYASLADGSAAAYYQEQTARMADLLDPNVTDPVFEPIQARPPLLYNSDITADPADWRNNLMRMFYHKDSVSLSQ